MTDTDWNGAPGWPRPRLVPPATWNRPGHGPATFVQSDPADPTSAHTARLQHCFTHFACQVCGEGVLEIDAVGWVLTPVANMGGACCTRCMYLALRACPHLADAPSDAWSLHAVTEPRAYGWSLASGGADGHVELVAGAGVAHDHAGFMAHWRAWRGALSPGPRPLPARST